MFFMKEGIFALLALLIASFMQGMITNYLSVLARENGLADYASLYFLFMGLGLMGSRLFSGYIVDHGFNAQLIRFSELATLGGAMLLSCTASPIVFVLCGTWLGISLGALMPSFQTILMSMYFIGMDGGLFLALLSGGVIADALGMDAAYRVGALGQLVSLAIFLKLVLPQLRRRKSQV